MSNFNYSDLEKEFALDKDKLDKLVAECEDINRAGLQTIQQAIQQRLSDSGIKKEGKTMRINTEKRYVMFSGKNAIEESEEFIKTRKAIGDIAIIKIETVRWRLADGYNVRIHYFIVE